MTRERYVVRKDGAGPDWEWVAEVDFDADRGMGELRHAGGSGLEGDVAAIRSAADFEATLKAYRDLGCDVARID